jgi:predicted GIY-YIG superfamily endonuclease
MGRPISTATVKDYVAHLLRKKRRVGYAVYYLLLDEEVVYVGCTSTPNQRFEQHQRRWPLIAMKVQCVLETQQEGERIEQQLIQILRARGIQLENYEHVRTGASPSALMVSKPSLERLTVRRKEELKARRLEVRRQITQGARIAQFGK